MHKINAALKLPLAHDRSQNLSSIARLGGGSICAHLHPIYAPVHPSHAYYVNISSKNQLFVALCQFHPPKLGVGANYTLRSFEI